MVGGMLLIEYLRYSIHLQMAEANDFGMRNAECGKENGQLAIPVLYAVSLELLSTFQTSVTSCETFI
jgi:hypothetical protein